MTKPSLTQAQEARLSEALRAQLFEQKAKELSNLGDAFAEKWQKRLREANQAAIQKSATKRYDQPSYQAGAKV